MFSRVSHVQRRLFSGSAIRRKTYGFIGLGQMGFPMATNLRDKIEPADTLYIYDTYAPTLTRFVSTAPKRASASPTVITAKSALEATINSDVILTVLPSCTHLLATLPPLIPSLPSTPPKLFLDCSTISPTTSLHLHTLLTSHGHTYLDTPMSGGVPAARTATLTFLLGGPPTSPPVLTALPTLRHLGTTFHPCGSPTAGLAAKLANNYLLAATNIATADAMSLGMALGVSADVLSRVIASSTGRCWPVEKNNPVPGVTEGAPAGRGYEGGFSVGLMGKDLGLATEAGEGNGVEMLLGERMEEIYVEMQREGFGGKDFSVVFEWMKKGKEKAEESN